MKRRNIFLIFEFVGMIAFLITQLLLFDPSIRCSWGGEYPERPITVAVPYDPGAVDRDVRVMAPLMGKILGQPVVVENRAGGGGSIGTNYVVQSRPEGYILLFAAGSAVSIAPALTDLPYKPDDLIPIACTSYQIQMLAVRSDTPWKTINEFIEYARKNPGAIKFGSAGTGTSVHLCGEALASASGIKLTHVPYKGISPAIADTIGGHIDCVFSMPQPVIPQVRAGKLRPIVVFSSERYPHLPEVPSIKEAGVPFEIQAGETWFGFFAPKGTPQPICDKLTEAVRKTITDPETIKNFEKIGSVPKFMGQKEFKASLEKQFLMYKELVERIGLKKK